eukprot:6329597-Alexandrium_andersonii.AAC.1
MSPRGGAGSGRRVERLRAALSSRFSDLAPRPFLTPQPGLAPDGGGGGLAVPAEEPAPTRARG